MAIVKLADASSNTVDGVMFPSAVVAQGRYANVKTITQAGWYRIATITGAIQGCNLKLGGAYNTTRPTSVDLTFACPLYSGTTGFAPRWIINSAACAGTSISAVRIANGTVSGGVNNPYIDIYIPTEMSGSSGQTYTYFIEALGCTSVSLQAPTLVTTAPTTSWELNLVDTPNATGGYATPTVTFRETEAGYYFFGKISNSSSARGYFTALITGGGGFSQEYRGIYLAEVNYYGSTFVRKITQLSRTSGGTAPTFGYMTDGTNNYIGIKCAAYSALPRVILLSQEGTGLVGHYGFYLTADIPYTWNAITTIRGRRMDGIATGVSSLSTLKTQMTTWITAQELAATGVYGVTLSGAVSPFPSGAHLSIQINSTDLANYGTAIITLYQSTAGALTYTMSYHNGTWTDPKQLAFA